MKQLTILLLLFAISMPAISQKNRLLVTTDIGGDPDDQQSLIRLMLYSNSFDCEGIISSAAGTPGELAKGIIRPDMIHEIIQAYQQVYPTLLKHDKSFASPGQLLSVVKKGNPLRGWKNVGMGHDTEASEWMIQAVDKKDKRPLNICIFGGQTDLAQALWKVKKNRTTKEYAKFVSKIRVYDIDDQDHIFNKIIADHPLLYYILAKAAKDQDKREGAYRGMYLGGDEQLTSLNWLRENVLENHGSLGRLYPRKTWTAPNPFSAMKEGDTPAWFYFLNNGLNDPDQPGYGGWGGRFVKNENGYYSDAVDSYLGKKNARATVYRWRDDFQRDFAARMDWCVREYAECNHAPIILMKGFSGTKKVVLRVQPGKLIQLDASGSKDPDSNQLSCEWMLYPEAGNFDEKLEIKTDGAKASFIMPELKPHVTLHLILKVTDNGIPSLTSYKRIIIKMV